SPVKTNQTIEAAHPPAAPINPTNVADKPAEKNVANVTDTKTPAPPPPDTAIQADKAAEPSTCLDLLKTPPKEAGTPGTTPLILSADFVTLDTANTNKVLWAFLKSNASNPLEPNDLLFFRLTQECDESKTDPPSPVLNRGGGDGKDKQPDCDPTKVPAGGP